MSDAVQLFRVTLTYARRGPRGGKMPAEIASYMVASTSAEGARIAFEAEMPGAIEAATHASVSATESVVCRCAN